MPPIRWLLCGGIFRDFTDQLKSWPVPRSLLETTRTGIFTNNNCQPTGLHFSPVGSPRQSSLLGNPPNCDRVGSLGLLKLEVAMRSPPGSTPNHFRQETAQIARRKTRDPEKSTLAQHLEKTPDAGQCNPVMRLGGATFQATSSRRRPGMLRLSTYCVILLPVG